MARPLTSAPAFKKDVRGLSRGALAALEGYDWPGNMQELENIIERSLALATRPVIGLDDLPLDLAINEVGSARGEGEPTALTLKEARDRFEQAYVPRALERCDWAPSVAPASRRVLRSAAMRDFGRPIGRSAFVLLFILLGAGVAAGRQEAPLTLVFTPSRDPTALKEAGDAFARTLTDLSGVPVRALVASDYAGVIEALRSRRVDLAFVHPVGYVLANREAGCRILVRDIWGGKTAYTARFYVRKDRGIRRVEDLKGKTVAFVDPASSSGYIYPMVLLIKQGLVRDRDPKTFFKDALFSGTHEAALQAVLRGRVDAAASFDKAPELHLKDPALIAQIGFVGETEEIPEAGICVRPGVPDEVAAKLKRALLSIKAPGHAAVLKQIYDIDGFVEADDRDYQPVRDAMQLMNLSPPK